jgi:hypothetical protein
MATGYIPLPAYKYPDNAMLDFKPLERGIDSARQWSQQQENAFIQRKQDARADEDQGMQRTNFGNQQTTFKQGQEDRTTSMVAKTALAAYNETDPTKKRLYWDSVLRRHPDISKYGPEYLDPETGPKLALAEAGMLPDPAAAEDRQLKRDLTRSQIDENRAQATRQAGPARARLPAGMQWNADGTRAEPIPGVPAAAAPGLKDYQTKDAMWAERLIRSEAALDRVAGIDAKGNRAVIKGPDGKERRAYDPTSGRNNFWFDDSYFNSGEWKSYQQAARESIAAILRKDTGAAVTDTEWNLYFPMYFPQPGDDANTVLQKKASRQAVAKSLKAASGPAWDAMFPDGGPAGVGPPSGKVMGDQPLPQEAPVRIAGDDDFNKLPSGAHFIGPDGKLRVKP